MIYLVTGMMRSGTSMMMECLEAGGIEIAKSDSRDEYNRRQSDELYTPNHKGLYELSIPVIRSDKFPSQYNRKAVKLVLHDLKHLSILKYLVVFMRRDPEEIRQSYESAFGGKMTIDQIRNAILAWLEILNNRKDVKVLKEIWYRAFLDDPLYSLKELKNLGWPIDCKEAAKAANPSLCRYKLENLTVGI